MTSRSASCSRWSTASPWTSTAATGRASSRSKQVRDAAFAVLEEEGCWGTVSFTGFFTLARIDGAWKIVNKTFAHTGGEPPAM
jgi:Putative lumazine-binding